jgi:hypothetical protein
MNLPEGPSSIVARPGLDAIMATVNMLNVHQRSQILIYVTSYLTTVNTGRPIDELVVREAYGAAFIMFHVDPNLAGI